MAENPKDDKPENRTLSNGKEVDSVGLEDLYQVRKDAVKGVGEMREVWDAKPKDQQHWTNEERSKWETINRDYDLSKERIDTLTATNDVNARFDEIEEHRKQSDDDKNRGRRSLNNPDGNSRPEITDEIRSQAVAGWMRGQIGREVTKRQKEAMDRIGVSGKNLDMRMLDDKEYQIFHRTAAGIHHKRTNDLRNHEVFEARNFTTDGSAGTDYGPYLPVEWIRSFEVAMLQFGGLRAASRIIRTNHGRTITVPTFNDTGNKATLVGEKSAVGNAANPALGKPTLGAHKYKSGSLRFTSELQEDDDLGLMSMIGAAIGERFSRGTEEHYTLGAPAGPPDGPTGLIPALDALGLNAGYIDAAAPGALTFDELLALEHAVDEAYRADAEYMMSDSIVLLLRLIKDSEGRPLWQSGHQAGEPDRLHGYVLRRNREMSTAAAATEFSALFGDFSKHWIRDVNGLRLYLLTEMYRESDDEDAFGGFMRTDSLYVNAGTNPIKGIKH